MLVICVDGLSGRLASLGRPNAGQARLLKKHCLDGGDEADEVGAIPFDAKGEAQGLRASRSMSCGYARSLAVLA